jgi:hypothetical protein
VQDHHREHEQSQKDVEVSAQGGDLHARAVQGIERDDPVGTTELARPGVVGELDERLAEEQRDDR